jgi:hypothetical protein
MGGRHGNSLASQPSAVEGVALKLLAWQWVGEPALSAGMRVSGDDCENLARGGQG